MTLKEYLAHPGRNPAHRFGKGRDRWQQKMPMLDGSERVITMLGPKNPGRWLPHQGNRECARRLRNMRAAA